MDLFGVYDHVSQMNWWELALLSCLFVMVFCFICGVAGMGDDF